MVEAILGVVVLTAVTLAAAVRYRTRLFAYASNGDSDSKLATPNRETSVAESTVMTSSDVTLGTDHDSKILEASDEDAEPEEFILVLLASHGGRMKQQWVVDARDWSAPVVSENLTKMEERGLVVRYTLGREKVVCLPENALGEEQ